MTNVAFPSLEDYRDVEIINTYREYQEAGKDLDELLQIVHIQGRDNARTPFQWENSKNGGFTLSEPWIKPNPNYTEINAASAIQDTDGIWHFYKKLLAWRKGKSTFVYGTYEPLVQDSESLFAYLRSDSEASYYVVLNFTSEPQANDPMPAGKWELVQSNYSSPSTKLQAWEGRIYQKAT
jgi:oligo-1,6-glucosidase